MSERKHKGIEGDTAVVTQKKTALKLKKPKLYKVLLHNDDFTTMEFVVMILQAIFGHSETDATAIMLHIHQHGVGVGGVYPFGSARRRARGAMPTARKAGSRPRAPWSRTTTATTTTRAATIREKDKTGNDDIQGAGSDAPACHRRSEAAAPRIPDARAPPPRAVRGSGGVEDPAGPPHRLFAPPAG